MCSCEGECVVTVIVKPPVLPPCVVDELYRNIPSVINIICVYVQAFLYIYICNMQAGVGVIITCEW